MVRRPERSVRQAGAHAAEHDVYVAVRDVDLDLLESASCQEWCGPADEGYEARPGKTCGHPHHVLLRNADVDETFGEFICEGDEVAGTHGVVADHDDSGVSSGELGEGLGEGLSAVVEPGVVVGDAHRASSAMAASNSARKGTRLCHSTRFSMKLTPLPLTVLAITQVGRTNEKSRAAEAIARGS
jgi:hypothetical protein